MRRGRAISVLAVTVAVAGIQASGAAAAAPRCTVTLPVNAPAAKINAELSKHAFTVVCLKKGTRHPEAPGGPALTLTASGSAALNYLQAKPKSHVVLEGGVTFAEGAGHIDLYGLHLRGAVQILGDSNIVIEHDELTQLPVTPTSAESGVFCSNCTKVGIYANTIHGFRNAPGEESESETHSGGGGDAVRFQGTTSQVWVNGNNFYGNRTVSGGPAAGETACVRVSEGSLAGYLEITRNYFHDNDCLGPLVQSEQPGSLGARVIYTDNLMVRNSAAACAPSEVCALGLIDLFVNDPYTSVLAQRDTELNNEGGAVIGRYDREQQVSVTHSVFELMHREPWCLVDEVEEPVGSGHLVCPGELGSIEPFTTSSWNYLQSVANQWVTGEHEQPEEGPFALPEFNCGATCGEGHTAANDDYRIKTNPAGIGIDWAPAELGAGPAA